MSDESNDEDDFLGAAIRGAIPQEDGEDDGPGFELVAGEQVRGGGKLIRTLRKARDEALSGQINIDEYSRLVIPIANQIEQALSMLEAPGLKNKRDRATPAEVVLHERSIAETARLAEGIESMLAYIDSHEKADLNAGMALAEEAMQALTDLEITSREFRPKVRD
jgi:hypothetical protein